MFNKNVLFTAGELIKKGGGNRPCDALATGPVTTTG